MKENLKQIVLDIHRGEYLADALHRQEKSNLPSHVILNKMLPGLGATHAELVSERNSIIIEPNVPAIMKKRKSIRTYSAYIAESPSTISSAT